MDPSGVPFPPELQPVRPLVENYVNLRLQEFAYALAYQISPGMPRQQVDFLAGQAVRSLMVPLSPPHQPSPPPPVIQPPPPPQPQQLPPMPSPAAVEHRALRLVLRHDCQSSGCGDQACKLCQYNPSRICKRNLKQKYLIDDHLRAKCGAGLRCEVVDEAGVCWEQPLGNLQLEVHVLNGDKYKEVCPDNTLLNSAQLRSCIIDPPAGQGGLKPLLRREGAPEEPHILLLPEAGRVPLSDLQCTTSSEALLSGKAPTFRLLVWAVDPHGQHQPSVTYVVSENFVVATKRVKHAIKSDIPSITDHVGKIVHIGKATVDKLLDLRAAAAEEKVEAEFPEHLNRIEKVGQFRELVQLSETSNDLKHKLRHLLKLSTDKWEEVVQHVLSAVVPDYRPRLWWHEAVSGGLLFSCKNGAIAMDTPMAFVARAGGAGVQLQQLQQLEPARYNLLPKLKHGALEDWYASGHPNWSIFWSDASDPLAQMMQPHAGNLAGLMAVLQSMDHSAAAGAAAAEAEHKFALGGGGYQMAGGYPNSRRSSLAHEQYQGAPAPGPVTRQRQSSGGGVSANSAGGYPQQPGVSQHPGYHSPQGGINGGMPPTQLLLQPQQMGVRGGGGGAAAGALHSPHHLTVHLPPPQQHLHLPQHPQHQPPPGSPHYMGATTSPHHLGGPAGMYTASAAAAVAAGALQPQQQQQQQQQPGSGHSTKGPSPFATVGLQSTVSDALGGGTWGAPASSRGAGGTSDPGCLPVTQMVSAVQPTSMSDTLALPSVPSLEMLNTEDLPPIGATTGRAGSLIDKNMWLPSIDSQGQAILLSDLQPSLGVEQLLHLTQAPRAGGGAGPSGLGGELDGPSGMERNLSFKFSMSLDLAEHVNMELKDAAGNGS